MQIGRPPRPHSLKKAILFCTFRATFRIFSSIGRSRGWPEILLADEPTASLDSTTGMEATRLLQHLAHERNRIVIAVSHDSRLVPYADRLIELGDGSVLEDRTAGS